MNKQTRNNFVSRIAVLMAEKYEKKRTGKEAHELSRTEETGSHDMMQSGGEDTDEGVGFVQSQERYIEVKGNAKGNPDIFFSSRQVSTLHEKRENYYVYVVSDAFGYPTLAVTRGDKLLRITEIKQIIPYAKWWSLAREQEFRDES